MKDRIYRNYYQLGKYEYQDLQELLSTWKILIPGFTGIIINLENMNIRIYRNYYQLEKY